MDDLSQITLRNMLHQQIVHLIFFWILIYIHNYSINGNHKIDKLQWTLWKWHMSSNENAESHRSPFLTVWCNMNLYFASPVFWNCTSCTLIRVINLINGLCKKKIIDTFSLTSASSCPRVAVWYICTYRTTKIDLILILLLFCWLNLLTTKM